MSTKQPHARNAQHRMLTILTRMENCRITTPLKRLVRSSTMVRCSRTALSPQKRNLHTLSQRAALPATNFTMRKNIQESQDDFPEHGRLHHRKVRDLITKIFILQCIISRICRRLQGLGMLYRQIKNTPPRFLPCISGITAQKFPAPVKNGSFRLRKLPPHTPRGRAVILLREIMFTIQEASVLPHSLSGGRFAKKRCFSPTLG